MKKKYQRTKLGNLYAINLPNGKFGFGRELQEGALAVYKHIGDTIEDVPQNEEYQFIVAVYKKALTCGDWAIVENRPFENEEESWQPPKYIWDMFTGKYRMYYKGQVTPSTKSECQGLEVSAVWESQHVVDRIMGIDKWEKATPLWRYIRKHGQEAFDEFTKDS